MFLYLLLLLLTSWTTNEAFVGITQKPFSTDNPSFIHVHCEIPPIHIPNKFWGIIGKPYPTNSWFSNLGFYHFPVTVFPYLVTTAVHPISIGEGITICLPILVENIFSYTSSWHDDLLLYINGLGNHTIVDYTLLGVTTAWSSPTGGASLRVPWVPGHPYITAFIGGGNFNISTASNIVSINGNTDPMAGECFTNSIDNGFEIVVKDLSTGNTQLWAIWVMTGNVKLCFYPGARVDPLGSHPVLVGTSDLPPTVETVLRIAYIKDPTTKPIFTQYSQNIVVGGDVVVPEDIGAATQTNILFNWRTVDSSGNPIVTDDVLMMGLPHHADCINTSKLKAYGLLSGSFRTTKGPLIGYVGASWTLVEHLTSTTWTSPTPMDPSKIETVRGALYKEAPNFFSHNNDTYGFGKYISALARLVLIADELNEVTIRNNLLTQLEKLLGPWLYRVTYRDTFLYDETWGGAISANGWFDDTRDYGNGMYNDHHFHNGYYIYASAVVLRYNPSWEWANHTMDLIRDIANPSVNDPYFTVTRHKDWYMGHSWAQGLDTTLDGKNQESTGEATNAYYAVMLYGLATGNDFLRNIGRVLLATEIRSARKYWQIMPQSEIYPPVFSQNAVVGIIWSDKADYATFFGNKTAYIHCIQMLPFTPISEDLLHYDWVRVEYPVLAPDLGLVTPDWQVYIILDMAIIAKEQAWSQVLSLPESAFFYGISRTNAYWWVATRPIPPAIELAVN